MSPLKIKLEYSTHFLNERKKYLKHNQERFDDYKKVIFLFASNPVHPGLNTEKLKNSKGIYTLRVNKSDRIFFIWQDKNNVLFIDIGKHDKYKRY